MHVLISSLVFCNIQSRARTHAVLVIGLYELLGNPTILIRRGLLEVVVVFSNKTH
jgi:hypothetical protein